MEVNIPENGKMIRGMVSELTQRQMDHPSMEFGKMIISKTPYRISFFGGGTDYPDWYKQYGGKVISTSIDKYCYIS